MCSASSSRIAVSVGVVAVIVGITGPAGSTVLYPVCYPAGLLYVGSTLAVVSIGVRTAESVDAAGCSVPVFAESFRGATIVATGVFHPPRSSHCICN